MSKEKKSYQDAESLVEQGRFEEAVVMFQELGSYEDAGRLLMYSRASLAAENGDYESAEKAFLSLGEYRDAADMLYYYEGRQAEAEGQSALEADDFNSALQSLKNAADIYSGLSSVRDASQREENCLSTLYELGRTLLDSGQFAAANEVFETIGSFKDSIELSAYCEACLTEADEHYLEAAEQFSAIPSVLDSASRADQNREKVYQQALVLNSQGEPESAIALFAALGSYRDAGEQRINSVRLLIQDRLKHKDYEGALFCLDSAPDAMPLERADESDCLRCKDFLDGFVEAYLHFSAGSMDSISGYYGVLPYIEQGGALDKHFYQVLMIGSYSHNSYFVYYGSELLDLFRIDKNCCIAYIRASASVNQPIGPVEVTRTFRILLRETEKGFYAETIDDSLYGRDISSGRPVVTGPLPNNELPGDEDGDGIIIVDVMKKGFNGTMLIVLDPSRVFVG